MSGDSRERVASFIVNITPGTPQPGHWCQLCALPSVWRVPLHTLTDSGLRDFGEAWYCDNCGSRKEPS